MKSKNYKTVCSAILVISLAASLVGCGKSNFSPSTTRLKPDVTPIPDINVSAPEIPSSKPEGITETFSLNPDIADVAFNEFAVTLLQESQKQGENTLISPLSILCALSMTANGAQENTLAQMQSVFGLPVSDLNQYMHDYTESLPNDKKCTLHLANSIWFKESDTFTPSQEFLLLCQDGYNAEIYQAPFDNSTLEDINHWVAQETDSMIPKILPDIASDAVMYLINALAFDAEWQNIYFEHQIRDGIFTTEDGVKQDAEMMYSEERNYLQDENAQGFIKYYANQKYAFAALLPNEGVSISDYIASLNGEKLYGILANPVELQVNAALPKFENEYDIEMSRVLQEMGMTDAFDAKKADFSLLGHSENGALYISRVLHKTFIAVDEKGTKAGASTAVEVREECAMIENNVKTVYLDRPFVYMIIDTEQNIPVFIGTVMEME